jgi:hypothetical protein
MSHSWSHQNLRPIVEDRRLTQWNMSNSGRNNSLANWGFPAHIKDMWNLRRSLSLLGALALVVVSNAATAESIIRLTPEQAACVAENVAIYLEESMEPVVVIPNTCPEPPSLDDLMAALAPQNLGRDLPEPKVGEPDAALVLMHSELECFGKLFTAGALIVEEGGLIAVELGDCDG